MELNEKWKEQAETFEDNLPYPFDSGTFGEYKSYDFGFERGFIKGAQTYADAVEKMLKEKVKSNQHSLNTMPPVYESTVDHLNTRIEAFKELLQELKSIQP